MTSVAANKTLSSQAGLIALTGLLASAAFLLVSAFPSSVGGPTTQPPKSNLTVNNAPVSPTSLYPSPAPASANGLLQALLFGGLMQPGAVPNANQVAPQANCSGISGRMVKRLGHKDGCLVVSGVYSSAPVSTPKQGGTNGNMTATTNTASQPSSTTRQQTNYVPATFERVNFVGSWRGHGSYGQTLTDYTVQVWRRGPIVDLQATFGLSSTERGSVTLRGNFAADEIELNSVSWNSPVVKEEHCQVFGKITVSEGASELHLNGRFSSYAKTGDSCYAVPDINFDVQKSSTNTISDPTVIIRRE